MPPVKLSTAGRGQSIGQKLNNIERHTVITKKKIITALAKERDKVGTWQEILRLLNRSGTKKSDKLFYPEMFSLVAKGRQFYTFDQLQRIQAVLKIKIFV